MARTFTRTGRPAIDAAARGWHLYEIACIDDGIKVSIDGAVTSEAVEVANGFGLLGFSVAAGAIEVRNVAFRELQDSEPKLYPGVYWGKDKSIVLPRAIHEGKPNYTRDALSRRIQGAVWIEAVMTDPDVLPTQLKKIIESLDPDFGLDQEALKAASKWRFRPGNEGRAARAGPGDD